MALDPGAVENFYKFQKNFNIGIELEVAYNPLSNTDLDCFKETEDSTITSEVEGAELAEFVLKYMFRKYFQHKEKIDKEISKILFMSYTNDGSCGTHVHISHPSITNGQNEDFLIYLDYYWVYYSQDKIKLKYPQVRHYSEYAKDNKGWLEGDQDDRYIQMNIRNAFSDRDNLAHVEFRGYDGLPNGELSTFKTRIQMKMLSFYIEDLCDEFTKAYFSFKQGIPCIPIETLNEITAEKVEEIMDMYALDEKPMWDSSYQLTKIIQLMHYASLNTSENILNSNIYYDFEEDSRKHTQTLMIRLLQYFTKWCEEPILVKEFLELVQEEIWAKNRRMINQVIRLYTHNDEGGIKPICKVVHEFVVKRNNVPPRGRRAWSPRRQRRHLTIETESSSASGTLFSQEYMQGEGDDAGSAGGGAAAVDAPTSPAYRPTSPDYSPYIYMQGEGDDADSAGGAAAVDAPTSPAYRPTSPAYRPTSPPVFWDDYEEHVADRRRPSPNPRPSQRRRVDGEDPLRDLRLRF